MMHVQYSFVERREPTAFAHPPLRWTPSLTIWAGIAAMIASTALAMLA